MGKRSWLAVAVFAAILLAVDLYLENERIESESNGATWLFAMRSGAERRSSRIDEEVNRLGSKRSWAGDYYCGDGLGFNISLSLAPQSGYVFTRSGDGGPWSESEDGSFGVNDGIIYSRRSDEDILQHGLRPVTWGGRSYLIAVDELIDFANNVNFGSEPRSNAHGNFLLRTNDEKLVTKGFPNLPATARAYLRALPLDAKISAVGADEIYRHDYGFDAVLIQHETTILLDVGRRQGALPGMEFVARGDRRYNRITVIRPMENSSLAVFSWNQWGSTPKKGWEVSTRKDSSRHFSPLDEPLAIFGTPSPGKRFPALPEDAASFGGTLPYFKEARENGLTVVRVAHLRQAAVTLGVLHSEGARAQWERLLHRFGANAFVMTRKSENGRPPRKYFEEIDADRVEWKGRPLDRDEFAGSLWVKDWVSARRRLIFDDLPFTKSVKKIRPALFKRLLHFSDSEYSGFAKLRVENLKPEQRAALASLWGLTARYGLLNDEIHRSPDWDALVEGAVASEFAALIARDPRGYAEYQRLKVPFDP